MVLKNQSKTVKLKFEILFDWNAIHYLQPSYIHFSIYWSNLLPYKQLSPIDILTYTLYLTVSAD